MADKLDILNEIAREARQINSEFHRIAREAYQFARLEYADPKYEAFRDSEVGRAWKKQKLLECNHRCPVCNKPINDFNSSIDHKHPRRHYPWLAWNMNNLWVICKTCNESKGAMQWDLYLKTVESRYGQAAIGRILKYAPPSVGDDR